MGQCFQTGTVSPAIFCCSRESLFNSTALYSSAAVIFGGLPGTLCYAAIQPCSLDSLICACTLITVSKKKFLESKMMKERVKWVNRKSKIGRFIEHKRKANRKEKKQILSRPSPNLASLVLFLVEDPPPSKTGKPLKMDKIASHLS